MRNEASGSPGQRQVAQAQTSLPCFCVEQGDKRTPELLLPIKTPGYRDNAQCPTEVGLDTPGGLDPGGAATSVYIDYIGSPTTTTININFYDYSTDNRSGLDCDPWCWSPQHRVHMACT